MMDTDAFSDQEVSMRSPYHIYLPAQNLLAQEDRQLFLSMLLKKPSKPDDNTLIPKLTSILQDIIPEQYEGKFDHRLLQLLELSQNCSICHMAQLAVFFIFNNLSEKGADPILDWISKEGTEGLFRATFPVEDTHSPSTFD
jgi:hypothetical protein